MVVWGDYLQNSMSRAYLADKYRVHLQLDQIFMFGLWVINLVYCYEEVYDITAQIVQTTSVVLRPTQPRELPRSRIRW